MRNIKIGGTGVSARLGGRQGVSWVAPGRVNLIGEHTDYNDGFVLPIALPYRTTATVTPSRDGRVLVRSAQRPGEHVQAAVADLRPGGSPEWAAYVLGVVWAMREAGHDVRAGADVLVDGRVPEGAGLSSSAALECAVAAALDDVLDLGLPRAELARLAQRAENEFVGMPSGIMDQMAAMLCAAGHALFLDCRSLDAEHVPFDPRAQGLVVLVVNTRAPHRLVDGEYADRRRSCEEAAAALGVPALRDVPAAGLDAALARLADDTQRRRVRHVVTENQRVLDTVQLLRAGRLPEIGPLLSASHASLRDDFEVTVPQLDVAVQAALDVGALGARMTGGGFGGCVLALVRTGDGAGSEGRVLAAVQQAYAERCFDPPEFFAVTPSAGAHRTGHGAEVG
jgi:galactokinase